MADVMLNGYMVDFDEAVNLMDDEIREAVHADIAPCTDQEFMDDEIREEVHRKMAPCSEQEFMDAYAKAHHEKYGEEFKVN